MRNCAFVIGGLIAILLTVQIGGCPAPNTVTDPNSTGGNNGGNNGGSTDPNDPNFTGSDPNSAGGTTDPNDPNSVGTDPNNGVTDPNNPDPNTGGTDPNNPDPNNPDPNSGGNTIVFTGSGIYSGTLSSTTVETLIDINDPNNNNATSPQNESTNFSIEFDNTTHALKQIFVFGYLNTPDMLVTLNSVGAQQIVNTFENGPCDPNNASCVTTVVTVTLNALNVTATTMHLELGVVHASSNANGYSSSATGVEIIDITLSGSTVSFTCNMDYDGNLHTGSLNFPNQIAIDSSATLTQ